MEDGVAPPPRKKGGLRTGFTTGSCAAAAAKAAMTALITGAIPESVTIVLPIGGTATFTPVRWSRGEDWAHCAVIKDAGDDPDATHGAAICARVEWQDAPEITLAGGEGVGVVTLPGLGLEVGGPAINPVPRTMITEEVRTAAEAGPNARGVRVTISVPNGEEIAKKTLNARLGIIGGISILGTWGIVKPYSTASWRASVVQAIQVAAANGQTALVLCTGSRSERYAMALYQDLPELAFVEMGIFTGAALHACIKEGARWIAVCGMVGKFAKLAQGHMQTHVAGNQVDTGFLARIVADCGADATLIGKVATANTARHVGELVEAAGIAPAFYARLAEMTGDQCAAVIKRTVPVEATLFAFEGGVLARSAAQVDRGAA